MPPSDAQETTNTKHEDRFNDYNETRREQSRPVDIDRGQSIPEDLQTRSIIVTIPKIRPELRSMIYTEVSPMESTWSR